MYYSKDANFESDQENANPFITTRLNYGQQQRLARYICRLSPAYKRLICLYYGFGFSFAKIRREAGLLQPQATLLALQDCLTRQMGLGRPIAARSWKQAVELALLRMADAS